MKVLDCLSRDRRLVYQTNARDPANRGGNGISSRRILVLFVNVVATFLTLFTGLRENPVVLFVSGKYDYARSRFTSGDVNYDIVRDDLLRIDHQLNLTDVGKNYKFIAAPDRSPSTVGDDRNVCLRVNSVNVSVMRTNFDDFWGSGTRRLSRYFYSISAPHCDVINFKPQWISDCRNETLNANASTCFQYVLDNFETLRKNRRVQMGTTNEYGALGAPYLRCRGRPELTFEFMTDSMLHHSYWAGGSFHVELQSSKCYANSIVRSSDWEYGLFEVQPADQASTMLIAVDNSGWFAAVVSYLYGFVSLVLIAQGIMATVVHSAIVLYIPKKLRFLNDLKVFKRFFPFMPAATMFAEDENTVIRFKGTVLMASNLWINHWMYIFLSIMDAVVSVRTTYVIFGKGTWYLAKKATFENFIFTCGALSRITWFTCMVHTLLRLVIKMILRGIKTLRVLRPSIQDHLNWYVDAMTLFLSYKIYSVLLFILLFLFLKTTGTVTLMVKGNPYKIGMYGGQPSYASFWQSELVCDYFVIVMLLTAGGWAVGTVMVLTKYRYVTKNRIIRLLQQRYVFVGWDLFVALDALGIDPYNPKLVVNDDTAVASTSLGSLLQQMYQSGPSGLVSFAGDYIFESGGFSSDPLILRFPTKKAIAMGLLETKPVATGRSTEVATKVRYAAPTASGAVPSSHQASTMRTDNRRGDDAKESKNPPNDEMAAIPEFKSLFDRRLRLFSEGTYGRLLFVDDHETGKYGKSETGYMEYSLRDALSYMGLHDIKFVLGKKKKLRVY
jgi:hypothetical protein